MAHDPSGQDTFELPYAVLGTSLAADLTDAGGTTTRYDHTQLTYDPATLLVTLPPGRPLGRNRGPLVRAAALTR